MARPQKRNADYFTHDAHASTDDDTLLILQAKYGNNGYAFWFKLMELLTAAENHYLDLSSDMKWQLFVVKMGADEVSVTGCSRLVASCHSIDSELWESRLIWCDKLVKNFADVYKKRGQPLPVKPIPDMHILCT